MFDFGSTASPRTGCFLELAQSVYEVNPPLP